MPGRTAAVLLTEVVQQAEAVQHQFRRNRASAKVTQVFKCASLSTISPCFVAIFSCSTFDSGFGGIVALGQELKM
jgi:hypothetical protein